MSSTNRGAVRADRDFYPTPKEAFDPLIAYLPKTQIWEPCCGDSRLIKWMREAGLDADGSDLELGCDFLKDYTPRDCIVTNPPFSIAQEIADHALTLCSELFLLQRINWLGSQKRSVWWRNHEPDCLFILSKRPSFTDNGITGRSGTDSCEYAWFYWGNLHKGIKHL